MKIWNYQRKKHPEEGFGIQEENDQKYSIWHDPHGGGYAYDIDWYLINDVDEYPNIPKDGLWNSFDEAYKWIVDNYGKITEIDE